MAPWLHTPGARTTGVVPVKSPTFVCTLALALFFVLPADTNQLVEIRLCGYYFPEPATVRMTVAVEPQEQNRTLRIEADGDTMYRATEVDLAGVDEKRLHLIEFKNLSAGSYTLRAEVLSANDVLGQATQELVVTANGGK